MVRSHVVMSGGIMLMLFFFFVLQFFLSFFSSFSPSSPFSLFSPGDGAVSCRHVGRNYVDVIDNHQDGIGHRVKADFLQGGMKYITQSMKFTIYLSMVTATGHIFHKRGMLHIKKRHQRY